MSQSDIRTQLQQATPEPLLPVEKKLIGFSLGTGLVLLVVDFGLFAFKHVRDAIEEGAPLRLLELARRHGKSPVARAFRKSHSVPCRVLITTDAAQPPGTNCQNRPGF